MTDRLPELTSLFEQLKDKKKIADRISEIAESLKTELDNELKKVANVNAGVKFNRYALKSFKRHYWTVLKKSDNEAEVRVPKVFDINLGWLTGQDDGYNYFKVNPVTNWISEIPPEIKQDLGFKEPLDIHVEGNVITGKDIDKAEKQYGSSVKRVDRKLIIKNESHFDLLCQMIRDGIMPFGTNEIPEQYLSGKKFFDLPDTVEPTLVRKAVTEHLKRSRTIVLLPTGFGKTFIGAETANQLKPRYLFIANKTTISQWEKRLAEFPKIKKEDYDICTFQYALTHYMKNEYTLVVVDEAQHIAADTFSEILKIKTVSMMGLSATPYREDGRGGEILIALFGYPIGADWSLLNNSRFYNPPTIHVWVYKDEKTKFAKFGSMMHTERKTLVYCDSLSLGEKISKEYCIPFIKGSTTIEEREKTLQESQITVGSRIIDEGVSVIDAEVGIEIDWKGVSRAQAMQRAGRVMHNKLSKETEHHIIMTVDEYNQDKNRLIPYYEKGMKVIHHKESGIMITDLIKTKKSTKSILKKANKLIKSVESKNELDESHYPLLKYPGVKKMYYSLSPSLQKAMLFFIDPVNQDKEFTVQQIGLNLGVAIVHQHHIKARILKPLIQKSIIVQVDNNYKQNLTSIIK